ncbi:hypothetical protein BJ912DRAFT_123664 [Pholiota molesta]|nr:hypothetical protein BJ912DRAFT_123664 [Pholiota molesta]
MNSEVAPWTLFLWGGCALNVVALLELGSARIANELQGIGHIFVQGAVDWNAWGSGLPGNKELEAMTRMAKSSEKLLRIHGCIATQISLDFCGTTSASQKCCSVRSAI